MTERERIAREVAAELGISEWLFEIWYSGGDRIPPAVTNALIDARCRVEELEFALNQHLCKYDLADWLACVGHPEGHCEVCAETKPHRHVKATPATDALNQSIRDVTAGRKRIVVKHSEEK